ncbi:MAG: hypothetical protein KAJ62_08695, partial [Desulfobacteraceae bacterium]|nr:hypothetical protein [Desulfobacteraceae bacterium]
KEQNRDYKGQWLLNSNKEYLWKIKCQDGFKASGTLTDPLKDSGTAKGKDSFNREVVFVFTPKGE